MKKLFLLTLIVGSYYCGMAQTEDTKVSNPIKVNIGPEVGFPFGNNAVEYSFIAGLSAQLEYDFVERFGVTLTAGYLNFSYKTVFNHGNQGFIPVLAGVKFYISPRAFLNLRAGLAFATSSIVDASNNVNLKSGSYFAYSPGIGHKFGKKMEGEFKFLGISNSLHQHVNSYELRFAYTL